MHVTLADGTVIKSAHVVNAVFLVGDVRMSLVARVVDNLSHSVVLGMDWLQAQNPQIDWVAYRIVFPLHNHAVFNCFLTHPVARLQVCSLQSMAHAVAHGATAWLALLTTSSAEAAVVEPGPGETRWDRLCNKFASVFEEPGTPAERPIKHTIELKPGSQPPASRTYRMSPTELAEVRR